MSSARALLTLARFVGGSSLPAMLLLAAACGESTPAATPTTIPTPTLAPPSPTATPIAGTKPGGTEREALEEIQAHTAVVRGLEPLAEVDIRFITREAAEAYLRQELEEDAGTQLAEAEPVYRLLGLISPGDDLMELELGLVTSQVMGFYDSDEEAMFLPGQDPKLDTLGIIALSHEFIHALQDQHFDLDALLEEVEDDGDWDAQLALTALVEGDATLAEMEYVRRFMSLADLLEIDFAEVGRAMAELDDFPQGLQQELAFPYEAGVGFASALFDEGGWDAIDNAFDAPPTTTEQILHPEKYLAGEARHEVALPDLGPELGEGWRLDASNTLGEFLLSNHLSMQLSHSEAASAAAGWAGDRWALYSDGAAGELLLLVVEWDAAAELNEFFAAYLSWLDARSGGTLHPLGGDSALWEGERESIYVSQHGGRAAIIVSTDGEAIEQARQVLQLP